MAFGSIASLLTKNNAKAGGTSTAWTGLGTAIQVGDLAVLVIALDNNATGDGDFNEVTSVVDDAGNLWQNAGEFTNGQGAAGAGATVSVWFTIAQFVLATNQNITSSYSFSPTSVAATGWRFSMAAGSGAGVPVVAVTKADDAVDATALTIPASGSLPSREYLIIRAGAVESNGTTYTASTNFTTFTHTNSTTSGAGAATNIGARGEFRIVTGTSQATDPTTAAADQASILVAFIETTAIQACLTQYLPEGDDSIAALFPDRVDYSYENAAQDVHNAHDAFIAIDNPPALPITDEFIPTLHPSAQGSEDVATLFPDRTDYSYENAAGDLLNTDVTAQLAPNLTLSTLDFSGRQQDFSWGGEWGGNVGALNLGRADADVAAGTVAGRIYSPDDDQDWQYDNRSIGVVGRQNRWFMRTDFAISGLPFASVTLIRWMGEAAALDTGVGVTSTGLLVLRAAGVDQVVGAVAVPPGKLTRIDMLFEVVSPQTLYVRAQLFLDPTSSSADDTISGLLTDSDILNQASPPALGVLAGSGFVDHAAWFDDVAESTQAMPAPTGTGQTTNVRSSLVANAQVPLGVQDIAALFPDRVDYSYENTAGDLLNQDVTAQLAPNETVANIGFETIAIGGSPSGANGLNGTGGYAPLVDNDLFIGTRSMRVYSPTPIGGNASSFGSNFKNVRSHNRWFVRCDVAVSQYAPTATSYTLVFWGPSDNAIALDSAGHLTLYSQTLGGDVVVGTTVVPIDTFFRIETVFERQDKTHAYMSVSLFLDPTGSVADEVLSAFVTTAPSTDATGLLFGLSVGGLAGADTGGAVWYDDIAASTASMPAPSGTAQVVSARPSLIANAQPAIGGQDIAALFPDRVDYTWENQAGDISDNTEAVPVAANTLQQVDVSMTADPAVTRETGHKLDLGMTATAAVVRNTLKSILATMTGTVAVARTTGHAVAATLTGTPAVVRNTSHLVGDIAMSCTAAVVRNAGHAVPVGLTGTVAMTRGVGKAIVVGLTGTIAITRSIAHTTALGMTGTVAITRSVAHAIDLAMTGTVAVVRSTGHLVALGLTETVTVVTNFAVGVLVQLGVTLDPSVVRNTGKAVAAGLTAILAITRTTGHATALAMTETVAIVRNTSHIIADIAATFAPVVARSTGHAVDATFTGTVAITRTIGKAVSVGLTGTIAFVRNIGKAIVVGLTDDPSVIRDTGHTTDHTVTFTTAITRNIGKLIELGATFTVAIDAVKVFLHLVEVTATFAPSVARETGKAIAVTFTGTVAVVRDVGHAVALGLTGTTSITKNIGKLVALGATFDPAILTADSFLHLVEVTATFAPSVTRSVGKTVDLGLSAGVTVTRSMTRFVQLSLSLAPAVTREVGKAIALGTEGIVSITREVGKAISIGLTDDPTVNRETRHLVDRTVTFGPVVTRNIGKLIQAASEFVAAVATDFESGFNNFPQAVEVSMTTTLSITRHVGKAIAVVPTFAPVIHRVMTRSVVLGMTGTVAVVRRSTRAVAATTTLTAAATRRTGKAITASTTTVLAMQRNIGKLVTRPTTLSLSMTRHTAKHVDRTVSLLPTVIRRTSKVVATDLTLTVESMTHFILKVRNTFVSWIHDRF